MIPTRDRLIQMFGESQINGESAYHQRWATQVIDGKVWLACLDSKGDIDGFAPYAPLDGFGIPGHVIQRMSRIDWHAVRNSFDDSMWLYSHAFGSPEVIVERGPVYRVFDQLFRDAGGYILRGAEAVAAEREADDIHAVGTACYR